MMNERKFYYACECPYGIFTLNLDGAQSNRVHRFVSGLERDNWIMADPTHREKLRADHPWVRAAKKQIHQFGLGWPVAV